MIGQIVFDDVKRYRRLNTTYSKQENQIKRIADEAYPSIIRRGGYRGIDIDAFPNEQLLSLKVFVDTKDAMGKYA